MEIVKNANLGLRFLLELCALAALGYGGYRAAEGILPRIALAIALPLVAAVVWGLFVAPNATIDVPTAIVVLLQIAVFGGAAVALARTGHASQAAAFAAVVIGNAALMLVWHQ